MGYIGDIGKIVSGTVKSIPDAVSMTSAKAGVNAAFRGAAYGASENTIEYLFDSIFRSGDTLIKLDLEKKDQFRPMFMEPKIVIDFIMNPGYCPRFRMNEQDLLTIGIDSFGYICIGKEENLYYPNVRLLNFIEEYFHRIVRFYSLEKSRRNEQSNNE